MKKIPGKTRQLVAMFLVLNIGASLALGFLFVKIKSANEEISRLANEIDSLMSKENTAKSLKNLAQNTNSLRAELKKAVLGKEEDVDFLGEIEDLGRASGTEITIETVATKELKTSPDFEQMLISVKSEGSWKGVMATLGMLELLPVENQIEQAVVSKKIEDKSSVWVGSFKLKVLKEKQI